MKKIGVVFLILGCFISNVKAASLCNYEEQVELSKSATNIKMSYEEAEGIKEPGTYSVPEGVDPDTYVSKYNYFKIKIVNVSEDIYVKLENSTNDEIKYIKYNDTDEGTFEIDWYDLTDVTTFNYTIYSSDETRCPNEELKEGVMTIPMINPHYNNGYCYEVPEFGLCKKYTTMKVSDGEFLNKITEHINKQKKDEESKNTNSDQVNSLTNFINENKVLAIVVLFLIVAGVVASVIVIKKRRGRNVI